MAKVEVLRESLLIQALARSSPSQKPGESLSFVCIVCGLGVVGCLRTQNIFTESVSAQN